MASLHHPLTLAFGVAVLHFLWQGTLVGLFAWGLLRIQPQDRPDRRYAIASAALALCVICFGVTALLAARTTATLDLPLPIGQARLADPALPAASPWNAAKLAGLFWAAGALVMLLRFGAQAGRARRLRTLGVSAPSPTWRAAFDDLKRLVGVAPGVRLLASQACRVPMVVGWWQPVVLVPASAFSGLGTDQLRSLLIHELAHLRRFDHLANALQSCVEIVLFFHPAVWLLSGLARQERECCCDAIAIQHIADPRTLARALADLAALGLQRPVPQTQLAANGGPLMQRIQRILASDSRPQEGRRGAVPLALGLTMASLLIIGGGTMALAAPDAPQDVPVADSKPAQDPAKGARPVPKPVPVSASARGGAQIPLHRIEEDLEQMQSELMALVKAGKLKPDEAKAKLAAVRVQLLESLLAAEYQKREHKEKQHARAEKMTGYRGGPGLGATRALDPEQTRKNAILQELDAVTARGRELQQAVAAGKLTKDQAQAKLEAISAQAVELTDLRDRLEAERLRAERQRRLEQLSQLEQERHSVEQIILEGEARQAQARERALALRNDILRLRASEESAAAREELRRDREVLAQAKLLMERSASNVSRSQADGTRSLSLADQLRQVELATAAGKLSKEQAISSLQSIRLAMRDMENALKEQLAKEERAKFEEAKRLLEDSF